jgi:hypothetical protein
VVRGRAWVWAPHLDRGGIGCTHQANIALLDGVLYLLAPRCCAGRSYSSKRTGFPFGEQVLNRVPRQDHDRSSAVLTVLQRGPTPERPRARSGPCGTHKACDPRLRGLRLALAEGQWPQVLAVQLRKDRTHTGMGNSSRAGLAGRPKGSRQVPASPR